MKGFSDVINKYYSSVDKCLKWCLLIKISEGPPTTEKIDSYKTVSPLV
jgi:hypothetical protein